MTHYAKRLVALMERHNMSPRDVARYAGCSAPAIYHQLAGRSDPSVKVLLRVAALFNVTTDSLLGASVRSEV